MSNPENSLQERLRALPQVHAVVNVLAADDARATNAARAAVDAARERVRAGGNVPDLGEIVEEARALLARQSRAGLRRVINATGVLVHTNLGRVPLGPRQLDAVTRVAAGYSNLEYDLDSGSRGSRYVHARDKLADLTGAEAALVVNNNAAAVLVAVSALCSGKEVVVSRGELIEIGGEFRIPDVVASGGARLREVGTTNRTHLGDYERAIGPETGAILKVHPSNYRMVGFTASVSPHDLARLARGRGVAFIHDLGSGFMAAPDAPWDIDEPRVADALREGADLVTFSGDKLLGGPQAGVIAGRAKLVARIESHPLMRALRPDKMTLAALEETLEIYAEGRPEVLPLWDLASGPSAAIEARARSIAALLESAVPSIKVEASAMGAVAGGGSLPGVEIPSWGVVIEHPERSAAELARSLRRSDPPVIARISDDRIHLDLRAVAHADDELLVTAVVRSFGGG